MPVATAPQVVLNWAEAISAECCSCLLGCGESHVIWVILHIQLVPGAAWDVVENIKDVLHADLGVHHGAALLYRGAET